MFDLLVALCRGMSMNLGAGEVILENQNIRTPEHQNTSELRRYLDHPVEHRHFCSFHRRHMGSSPSCEKNAEKASEKFPRAARKLENAGRRKKKTQKNTWQLLEY